MLMFGLRLGPDPRVVVTTTPKPIKIIRELIADPTTVITRGSTYDNRANLAPAFLQQIVRKYEGTRLGRQELNAEILDDVPGALWSRALIEETRWPVHRNIPDLVRIVVAIDPAVSTGEDADETGIIVAGKDADGHGYVLADQSARYAPTEWARTAIALYRQHKADRIVAEVNNGGKSRNKRAAFLFLLWATSKPTSLQTAAAGLATTRVSAWSSEDFKKAFGSQAAAAALTNLQNADVDRAKAILFHPQSRPIQDAFMIGVNEVATGAKSAKSAMTTAAEKANAAIHG